MENEEHLFDEEQYSDNEAWWMFSYTVGYKKMFIDFCILKKQIKNRYSEG